MASGNEPYVFVASLCELNKMDINREGHGGVARTSAREEIAIVEEPSSGSRYRGRSKPQSHCNKSLDNSNRLCNGVQKMSVGQVTKHAQRSSKLHFSRNPEGTLYKKKNHIAKLDK